MTELEGVIFLPLTSHQKKTVIQNQLCPVFEQITQVKVNEKGEVLHCVLAKVGCRIAEGKPAPWGRKCLLHKKE